MQSIKKQLEPTQFKEVDIHKSAGILDDHSIRKTTATREAEIQNLNKSGNPLTIHSDVNLGSKNLTTTGNLTGTSFTIGGNTLDTNEWAYLDGQNQAVKTTSSPQFTTLGVGVAPSATSFLNAGTSGTTLYNAASFANQYAGTFYLSRGVYAIAYGRSYLNSDNFVYGGDFSAIALAGSYINPYNVRTTYIIGGKFISKDYTGVTYNAQGTGQYKFMAGDFEIPNALGNWTTNNPPVTTYGIHINGIPTGYGTGHTHYSIYSDSGNNYFNGDVDAASFTIAGTPGISATITTAKLTAGGANGSMTFVNGILTAQTQAT